MSIWNKVLLGLIAVASLGLFFMAMWTLKTHQYWASLHNKIESRIALQETANEKLAGDFAGDVAEPGIRQVRADLSKLLLARRRAWFHCEPKIKVGYDEGTAEVTLKVDQPAPHGIAAKTVVYAFEEAEAQKKGQYLGEFAVSNSGDKQVTLTPTSVLSKRELDRLAKLAKTKRPWVVYEIMPQDTHNAFAGLSEEQLKAMLPAGAAQEYIKDGKPAAKDDPKGLVVGSKYVRALRNYSILFDSERRKQILLSDSIGAAKWDKQLIEDALADARKQEETCKKDIVASTATLKNAVRDRSVVDETQKKIEEKLAAMQAMVAKLLETNKAMAGQIAKFQLDAARRIDDRTRAMAQSGAERR